MICRAAPAKVNLYLHVTGRREDGYHLLDSLVAFIDDAADQITLAPAHGFSLTTSGPFSSKLPEDSSENLMVKAAQRFCAETGIDPESFSLHIEKNIPLGAGLGGGSSDAAQTIHALENFTGIAMEPQRRNALLLSLGADVPVCYAMHTARMAGIGEEIETIPPLPCTPILLLWPDVHSDTKAVFSLREKRYQDMQIEVPQEFSDTSCLVDFLNTTRNDLRDAAISLNPVIAQAEEFMRMQPGCLLSRMSGSGASVFGLFDTTENSRIAQEQARSKTRWWAQTGTL